MPSQKLGSERPPRALKEATKSTSVFLRVADTTPEGTAMSSERSRAAMLSWTVVPMACRIMPATGRWVWMDCPNPPGSPVQPDQVLLEERPVESVLPAEGSDRLRVRLQAEQAWTGSPGTSLMRKKATKETPARIGRSETSRRRM